MNIMTSSLPADATMPELSDSLEDVSAIESGAIIGAAQKFAEIASRIGFRVVVWHDISSKNGPEDGDGQPLNETAFGWTGENERWWDEPQIALGSPIALACRYESEPFWANTDGLHGLTRKSSLILRGLPKVFVNTAEMSSMIVVPVHLAFGQIGLVCCIPMDADQSDLSDLFRKHAHMLSAISHRFLKTYNQIKDTRREIPKNCTLTRRQVQCLQWASQGKTDRETGMILSLSHAAVRYHLQCAVERLGCVNRTQAVFRAGQLGYVGAI